MFNKLLIANRGEIACRVIKTAKKMGIQTVAVYSDADENALHVQMADEAVHIGGSAARDSYLLADRIIEKAKALGVDAIHPGYGFLSENSVFAENCAANNITFVGPPSSAIDAMGSKSKAKQIMEQAGVPLVPGYHGDDQSAANLKKTSDDIGYPVVLKAAAGGGGKGMRQVFSADEFDQALAAAKREAQSSFGDDIMLVEKYLTQPRHVEIQVFCDNHGDSVYLFERDCSLQRRHQKVIEEAPAPGLPDNVRVAMGEAAVKAAEAIGYRGAGTVEFLYNGGEEFYFMEMNTRLQVEHPVTEMITGQDLVEWQLRVANNEALPLKQNELRVTGHSFEARIYAEDADKDFLPATGTLKFLLPPEDSDNVRVDTGVRRGDEVSVFYDPMIAKLIVWDEDRNKALKRLTQALSEFRIGGMTTNLEFLYNLASVEPFKACELDTHFIEKHHELIFRESSSDINNDLNLAALLTVLQQEAEFVSNPLDATSPWNEADSWRLNEIHKQSLSLKLHDKDYELSVVKEPRVANQYSVTLDGNDIVSQAYIENGVLTVVTDGHRANYRIASYDDDGKQVNALFGQKYALQFSVNQPDLGDAQDDSNGGLTAPMNGTLVTLMVEAGASVTKDQPMLIMEAMKMEHTIKAPADGTVDEFFFKPGDLVDGGAELLAFTAAE